MLGTGREEIGFVVYGEFPIKLDVVYFSSGAAVLIFTKISAFLDTHDESLLEDKEQSSQNVLNTSTRVFLMRSLNIVLSVASRLNNIYSGVNTVYKDEEKEDYYLVLNKSECSDEEFNQICNVIEEFGEAVHNRIPAYFSEHCAVIVADHAIQTLATI